MAIKTVFFEPDSRMPNNPALPVLIYDSVLLPAADMASAFEDMIERNGWGGMWRNGIYDYHHYHPNAHEALAVAAGSVTVRLGGEGGEDFKLAAGDALILPAGTGHRKLRASADLLVIGAYPPGQEDFKTCKSLEECPGADEQIAALALPETDPFTGQDGPLVKIWAALRN